MGKVRETVVAWPHVAPVENTTDEQTNQTVDVDQIYKDLEKELLNLDQIASEGAPKNFFSIPQPGYFCKQDFDVESQDSSGCSTPQEARSRSMSTDLNNFTDLTLQSPRQTNIDDLFPPIEPGREIFHVIIQ
jgi:hypothetical protein